MVVHNLSDNFVKKQVLTAMFSMLDIVQITGKNGYALNFVSFLFVSFLKLNKIH